jgi:tripeptidyl-peptidase I
VAAVWSLLNAARLDEGKKPLGNLNHLIYTMAHLHPQAFKPVVAGNNKCTIGTCCEYGYGNAHGYDAVNGFGTPNYVEMLKYIKTLP